MVMVAVEFGAGTKVEVTWTVCVAPGCRLKLAGEKVTPLGRPVKDMAIG